MAKACPDESHAGILSWAGCIFIYHSLEDKPSILSPVCSALLCFALLDFAPVARSYCNVMEKSPIRLQGKSNVARMHGQKQQVYPD